MCFRCCWQDLDEQDLMEFIWFQNEGDIDFQLISAAENANKFQKTRFWKEKSVEDMVTLGPTAQATLVYVDIKLSWIFTLTQMWIPAMYTYILHTQTYTHICISHKIPQPVCHARARNASPRTEAEEYTGLFHAGKSLPHQPRKVTH